MKVRIVSDGTPDGTRIYDDKGKEIPNVVLVDIILDPSQVLAFLTLAVPNPELDLSNIEIETEEEGELGCAS